MSRPSRAAAPPDAGAGPISAHAPCPNSHGGAQSGSSQSHGSGAGGGPPLCLAFSGAGLHGFYFNGVCQYIHEQEMEVKEAWGSSAGALAALSVLMKVGPEAYEAAFKGYDRNYHHMPWMFWHGRDFVWEGEEGGIRKFMPDGKDEEQAWLDEVVNGRLHIVVTKLVGWRFERVVVNNWHSVEDLIGCVRATMTIPGITATRPFSWRGARWLDGGFMDQHPSTDKAIMISTSLPVQPWAHSWQRHVDIFRHLPLRMAAWHSHVSGRRDMFKLGYMDAKTYFEGGVGERSVSKPVQPKARAVRFLLNLGLELVQGSFVLVLTARFVLRRKAALWRRLLTRQPLLQLLPLLPTWASSRTGLRRLGLLLEISGIAAASFFLWLTTFDFRLDLSEHLLDLAGMGLGKKRSSSSSLLDAVRQDRASRRARSQPCRPRRA